MHAATATAGVIYVMLALAAPLAIPKISLFLNEEYPRNVGAANAIVVFFHSRALYVIRNFGAAPRARGG